MAPNYIFPKWNPHKSTIDGFENYNYKRKLKFLRNSSSGFIAKKEVRLIIFSRDNYACKLCGSIDNLQVDHIVSVVACSLGEIPISYLNLESNLQTLCGSCNAAKKP